VLIPPETLIDGCVRTLLEAVLPDVGSRFARGQLYAVADVLRNLRDRVETKQAPLADEARAAGDALERASVALAEAGQAGAALALRASAEEAPAAPPLARTEALERAITAAFETLDALPADAAHGARRALAAHLAQQAMRGVASLKPSLLNEISKG